jgi:four helix bundle protein
LTTGEFRTVVPATFDHEKLDVYQLELSFVRWVCDLRREFAHQGAALSREACDHLDRASLSALLNTAEGNGKRQRQTRAKFFDDARGSATECAACLDALTATGACTADRVQEGKEILVRVVSMLTKLIQRYSDQAVLREDEGRYEPSLAARSEDEGHSASGTFDDENDDEDEHENEHE